MKSKKINKLIDDMAKMIIEQNETFLGPEVTEKAKEKIDNQNLKEGGKEDGEKTKAKTTRRTRNTI